MIDIFLDCDNTFGNPGAEIDDGLLILYLLGEPRFRLRGISLTFGNGDLEEVEGATDRLLGRLGVTDVPVYTGAAGAGALETPAAEGLVEAARRHEELHLLATGPLTNLAGAMSLDRNFRSSLSSLTCMGGIEGPLHYPKREGRELNFSADSQAAWSVLSAPEGATLFPAETCMEARFGLASLLRTFAWPAWARWTTWRWFRRFSGKYGTRGFYLWDLLPALWLLETELFEVEECGFRENGAEAMQEGMLSLKEEPGAPLRVARHVRDPRRVLELLFQGWRNCLGEAK